LPAAKDGERTGATTTRGGAAQESDTGEYRKREGLGCSSDRNFYPYDNLLQHTGATSVICLISASSAGLPKTADHCIFRLKRPQFTVVLYHTLTR